MKFEWDAAKAEINQKKHKISFAEASLVFRDPLQLTIPDPDHSEGEQRWITMGQISSKVSLVVVCHTYRDKFGEEVIRIYSARQATTKEKRFYKNG
jgi:uncharacterized protein